MKICFIDTLGLSYDGSTLSKRGLGGSESAVILISKELAKLGLNVAVFNDCTSDDSKPGIYEGVKFLPLSEVENDYSFDVMIASRSVAAFAPVEMKDRFKTFTGLPDFTKIQANSTFKTLWMHDTFCDGDDLIEDFIRQGRINEIFTLSDWHTGYVTHCDHGKRRNFDILKNHIFQTRNGIGAIPKGWIDVKKKDPDLFVFNASVTKGMVPLVENIWPRVKAQIPQAKLKVIGGYYRFREGSAPDDQEKQWRQMVANHPEIEFTGIISQGEISDILTQASYMIYPAGFPETFGISTLEALAHNVPLITCRFGALEETAFDIASWKIDYPVEPNWALPWLNRDEQIEIFSNQVVEAYHNKYLHQQKMYACNQIKDICGWDSVALQWKQHLYKKTGNFLPVDEYRKVSKINYRVHKVFGRRFFNMEELYSYKSFTDNHIAVITPVYNAEEYIEKCILSVAQQDFDNYTMTIVDDASTDNTVCIAEKTIKSLPESIRWRFFIKRNRERKGAVANQYKALKEYKNSFNTICILLDGDDWLVNDPNIFNKYIKLYNEGAEFTYGSCWSVVDNIPLIAQEYPPEIKAQKKYREYFFNWNMPYTHLRTFSSELLHDDEWDFISEEEWKIDGEWPMAGGDTIVFYNLIEKADPNKVICVPDIVYCYNDKNPINDYKVNGTEQTMTANKVLNMKPEQKFSVVVPTMWRCKDLTMRQLKALKEHPLVDDVHIIDNDSTRTPIDELMNELGDSRFRIHQMITNVGVNPAWNLGVSLANHDLICIMNDDIEFDTKIFDKLQDKLYEGSGPYGLLNSDPTLGQPSMVDGSIRFKNYEQGECIHCWGQLFFFHKSDWTNIPNELLINFGDDFIFYNQLEEKKNPIHLIYDMVFKSPCSMTVTDPTVELVTKEQFEKEKKFYENYANKENMKMSSQQIIKIPAVPAKKKRILIAIPTARYIEPDTFKSIYDLKVPDGYETDFQYFYGYRVDQVRNLIADWTIRGYDYLFAVDHDITFAPDTLEKLLSHDKDLVSGIYRQRLEPQMIEIYSLTGGRTAVEDIYGRGLVEIGGCGFGCVLVKKEVFSKIGYPQFEYHVALDHNNTFSEDNDFCKKARANGFRLYCDPSILCGHIGSSTFTVSVPQMPKSNLQRFEELRAMPLFPQEHKNHLASMKKHGFNPKVVYDIGASVLHWYDAAKEVWPEASIIAFDGMKELEELYHKERIVHSCGVLTDKNHKKIAFYQNLEHPGGNSVYKENTVQAETLFPEPKMTTGYTLDYIRKMNDLQLPDLIKMDIQGSELDVLKGAQETLKHCDHLILELQHVEYNRGAPLNTEVIEYLKTLGYECVEKFTSTDVDGDYYFVRTRRSPD